MNIRVLPEILFFHKKKNNEKRSFGKIYLFLIPVILKNNKIRYTGFFFYLGYRTRCSIPFKAKSFGGLQKTADADICTNRA